MLTNLLNPSQRRVLPLFAGLTKPLTVSDISRLVEMPYSTTHTTLKQLEKAGLVASAYKGNTVTYWPNKKDSTVRSYLDLLARDTPTNNAAALSWQNVSDGDVEWNLVGLGAPFHSNHERKRRDLLPEVTLGLGLRLSRTNPSLARAFPLVLAKQWPKLHPPFLCHVARATKELQTLGFYLDVAGLLTRNKKLRVFATTMLDRRRKKDEHFFLAQSNKYSNRLAQKRRNALSRKWHFLLNLDMQAFQSLFDKFYE